MRNTSIYSAFILILPFHPNLVLDKSTPPVTVGDLQTGRETVTIRPSTTWCLVIYLWWTWSWQCWWSKASWPIDCFDDYCPHVVNFPSGHWAESKVHRATFTLLSFKSLASWVARMFTHFSPINPVIVKRLYNLNFNMSHNRFCQCYQS